MTASDAPTPRSLDHVALWVADRDAVAELLCGPLGMHVIERTEDFTLVGVDARLGKLTLFAAAGPREPGVLERVVLRVQDLERAVERLPSDLGVERAGDVVRFRGPEGIGLGLTAAAPGQRDSDLDHVVLRVPDPQATAEGLAPLGFEHHGTELRVADRAIRLVEGAEEAGDRPLLNHLALLVDSADAQLEAARSHGVETDEIKDAANTYAGFVTGPNGIRIEYVEHKPTFDLV